MRRKTRLMAQVSATGLPRRRQDVNPQPVPTFQPDPKMPPPPRPQPAAEDEAVEAAINRMVEAAYT